MIHTPRLPAADSGRTSLKTACPIDQQAGFANLRGARRLAAAAVVSSWVCLVTLAPACGQSSQTELPKLREIRVTSSLDQTAQPVRIWTPPQANRESTPVLVFLHSWSGDYRQDNSKWLREAVARNWIFLHPNFRGRNDHPEACGSRLARQDILDALDWVQSNYVVDSQRTYLAGVSGGGHMTMLMVGYHSNRFSAASAWVGISDLKAWHDFHATRENGKPSRYALMMQACCGGRPGDSEVVDRAYHDRSPVFFLHQATEIPFDINAGVHDGHTGSVPIRHSLEAFNAVAAGRRQAGAEGEDQVTENEMRELWEQRRLSRPRASDEVQDREYGVRIFLRRSAGPARVTIFDGGHESLPAAACAWLSRQRRPAATAEDRKSNR